MGGMHRDSASEDPSLFTAHCYRNPERDPTPVNSRLSRTGGASERFPACSFSDGRSFRLRPNRRAASPARLGDQLYNQYGMVGQLRGACAQLQPQVASQAGPTLAALQTLGETGYYFLVAFALSITFMYLILAAQFESWLQPIAILMALPVTIPFGMLSLVLFRTPMDLYAMFGLFMLVGIVKKNGILQVDATNQLRTKGLPRLQAILEANQTRLRPILMTTVMLVAAMVPIALGQGPGAGARASMA